MKKAWGVILIIVLVAAMLGVVSIGVGIITGADMARIYSNMADNNVVNTCINWINTVIETINSVLVTL